MNKLLENLKNLKLIILFIGVSVSAQSEHFYYTSFEFDTNKVFGFKDNPDTITDNRGLDWNLEAGIRYKAFSIYAFYGRFDSSTTDSRFYNYGAGFDYVLSQTTNVKGRLNLDITAGLAYSPMFKQDSNGNWAGVGSIMARSNIIVWFGENSLLGIKVTSNIIDASDKNQGYRFEASLGLLFRLTNSTL